MRCVSSIRLTWRLVADVETEPPDEFDTFEEPQYIMYIS